MRTIDPGDAGERPAATWQARCLTRSQLTVIFEPNEHRLDPSGKRVAILGQARRA
jgi:hypothetical protein